MTKAEIVKEIAEHLEIPRVAVSDVLGLYMDIVASDLMLHGRHQLMNRVGTLKVIERAAREGRNPRTGELIDIPRHKTITFVPAKRMKEAING